MMSQPILDNSPIQIKINSCLFTSMSTESLNRTSEIVETPSQYVETPKEATTEETMIVLLTFSFFFSKISLCFRTSTLTLFVASTY